MTPTFDENRLRFQFDAKWAVVKYDEHRDYRERLQKLAGSKAVDFVGIRGDEAFLIEVKDFRGHRIANKQRLTSGELAAEVGQKVRDTIAGLVGAYRTSCEPDSWRPFARAISCRQRVLKIIVWLEDDMAKNAQCWSQQASVLQNLVKQQTFWITARVLVVNGRAGSAPPGLVVSNLPGAGQP